MKAWSRDEYGDASVLSLVQLDRPEPKAGQVRIQVKAVGLNASDTEFLSGRPAYARIYGLKKPRIKVLGSDLAGQIDALGEGVSQWQLGQRVYLDAFEHFGALAEYVCVPAKLVSALPDFMSFAQGAALPQAGCIAFQAFAHKAPLQSGQRVLINGAAGGAGSFAVQLAKAAGAYVVAIDKAEKLPFLQSLGADEVIDCHQAPLAQVAGPFDRILDMISCHPMSAYLPLLAKGGRYQSVGGQVSYLVQLLYSSIWARVQGKRMGLLALKTNEGLAALCQLLEQGQLAIAIDQVQPFDQVPQAMADLLAGRVCGKRVIQVAP